MQVNIVEDYYYDENSKWCWKTFGITVGVAVPLVAGGGNWLRWKMYEWWILKSGTKVKKEDEKRGAGDEGDNYVQMT